MKIELDIFELSFLIEACLPPKPIARAMFFDRVIDEIYHELTVKDRALILKWAQRSMDGRYSDNTSDPQYLEFVARYDAGNQYLVKGELKGKTEEIEAYLFNGEYKTTRQSFVRPDAIVSVEKIKQTD